LQKKFTNRIEPQGIAIFNLAKLGGLYGESRGPDEYQNAVSLPFLCNDKNSSALVYNQQ
jgi:hypothetical protein